MKRLDHAPLAPRATRIVRGVASVAISLAIAAGILAAPTGAPPVAAIGPLPACRLADLPTLPRGYESWSTTLVDWLLGVGEAYVPPDLVSVRDAGIGGSGQIRQVAIADLRDMAAAAARAGTPIAVSSAYRSYAEQVKLFDYGTTTYGHDNAILFWQQPGHSEHQLGLGIDFMSAGGGSPTKGDWATTPPGAWMAENAWKYGWVLSYPKDPGGALFSDVTCFHYEPWHYRYLGRDIAARVHRSGLTIREFLWENYTMVDPITGSPIPTATPAPSPSPTPAPTPTAMPTPTVAETTAPSPGPSDQGQATGPWSAIGPVVIGAGIVLVAVALIGLTRRRGGARR